ncbi:MAG TPA: hypothetical protein VK968_05505, partial [Roseimicrobium sp.]|nr:hypothetical protein [Roseimicrobium sp.]
MSQDDFRKAKCQHCGGRISYPAAAEGTSIPCPHCAKDAILIPAFENAVNPPTPSAPPPATEPPPAPGEIRIRVIDQPAPKPVTHKSGSSAPSAPPSKPAEEAPKRVVAKFKSSAEKSNEAPKPDTAAGDMVACRQCGTVGQVDLMRREGETYICLSCQPARRGGVSVPQELSLDVSHAGFWRRMAAKCIDLLILTGPVVGIGFALKPAMPKLTPLMQQIPL